MDKKNELTLNVINEIDQCPKKIDCCKGNKPSSSVRVRPRTAIIVGIVLSFWVIWNKYYRKSG